MAQTVREEEAAEASFRRALEIQPWHRDATTRLAALLGKRGRDAEARQLLEAALAAAPCGDFHAALGNLLFSTGLPEQAAEQYRAAIERKAGDAITRFNLGHGVRRVARYGRLRGNILPRRPNCGRRNGCGGCGRSFAARWCSKAEGRLKRIARGWRRWWRGGRPITPHRRPSPQWAEGAWPSPPAPVTSPTGEESSITRSVMSTTSTHGIRRLLPLRRGENLDEILEAGRVPRFSPGVSRSRPAAAEGTVRRDSTSRASATSRRRRAAATATGRGSASSSRGGTRACSCNRCKGSSSSLTAIDSSP